MEKEITVRFSGFSEEDLDKMPSIYEIGVRIEKAFSTRNLDTIVEIIENN